MKSIRNSYIFALLFGFGLFAVCQTSKAGTGDFEKRAGGMIISTKSEAEFSAYIGKNLPKYVQQKKWSIINRVVTLYTQKPSEIRALDVMEVNNFQIAVAELSDVLEKINSSESLQWKDDLERTAGTIKFIRNLDINSLTGEQAEIQAVKAPVI